MTDNDYIAEYIKEKFPEILGFDFLSWKIGRIFRNGVHSLIEIWKGVGVSETCDDTEDDEGDDEREMTQEEVLSILDTIPTTGRQVDALEMAIAALEEQITREKDIKQFRDILQMQDTEGRE